MNQTLIVGVVYRPPNSNIADFNDCMHFVLEKIACQPCYIMGDFNLDLLKHELHPPTEKFLDTMYANSLIPVINRPTRVTKDTCTLIDNIFTNDYDIIDNHFYGILQANISDHYVLFHIRKIINKTKQSDEYKIVRIINQSRTAQYIERIQKTDWSSLNTAKHCQAYFSKFLYMFKNIYDKSFPVKKVKTQYRSRLPWLSFGLKLSIKYKNKLYRISIKHPTSYNINAYKLYKNKLTSILKEAEKVYYQTEIISNKSNLRKVWAIIKQVINKTKTSRISDKFMHNKTLISDPVNIANCFNNYFVNIGPTLASKLRKENISHRDFLPERTTASLFLEPTDEVEIKKIIRNLKEGAPGQDGITANNIKCITDHIAAPLTHIVNLSFEQGIFPEELKTASVTPLYKAKDPMLFNNYRPISLLSVFSKIIERLMYNRLSILINKHKFFNKYQFGFRNNHSTFMALIILIENLLTALDNGNCAVGIFLDFQKAFDTVDHNILLDKLHWYGIRGTAHEWFCSYLHNRKQSAIFNGYESEYKLLKCGVPQGSILGPLLFLVYINDLPSVSDLFMPILFADDTNLFCTGKDLKALSHKINEEIAKIYAWVNANKLSLNIDKTNFMLFTPRNSSRCIDDIVINGIRIAEVTETKFLGVIIDNKLKWSTHILYIRKKIAKGIGILLKARKCFNNETLLSLYHTFVYPYLSYCIHVWGRAYDTHLNDLIVLQNKIIRIINGVPPRTNVERLYVTMGILSLKRIYNYAIGLFMHKYVNNMLPELFVDFFSNVTDLHHYNTRHANRNSIYVTFHSSTRGQQSFSHCGPRIWNFILSSMMPNCAIGLFKTASRQLFLKSECDVINM